MKTKMVWKLTACFAVVLLLFTTVLGAVYVTMFRRHTISINRTAMQEQALSIADTLASFASGEVKSSGHGNGGYGAYLRFLNSLASSEVWVVDENLNLITQGHNQVSSYGSLPDNAEQIVDKVFEGEMTYGEEFSGILETPTLTVGVPIKTDQGITGAVLLHSPASGVDEAVFQGISALLMGIVAALLFAILAAYWLSYRFTSPLRRMQYASLKLAEGDYDAKTGVEQTDEIGQLALTIDFLSGCLSQAEQERAALDQLKQDFITNVSHELRTPVAVLRGSLEVLHDGTVHQPEEIKEFYEQMMAESFHLERLVNDLLDLSRLQDAQFSLDIEEINLCDIVRDAARAIRRPAQAKEISVATDCPEQECLISGDYGRIRQLILILLDNAVKFSPKQGFVELTLVSMPGYFLLSVSNSGDPIPPQDIPMLFERFYKTSGMSNRSGTGLGLAIAKQIAARHHADIHVSSDSGKTVFSVHFRRE